MLLASTNQICTADRSRRCSVRFTFSADWQGCILASRPRTAWHLHHNFLRLWESLPNFCYVPWKKRPIGRSGAFSRKQRIWQDRASRSEEPRLYTMLKLSCAIHRTTSFSKCHSCWVAGWSGSYQFGLTRSRVIKDRTQRKIDLLQWRLFIQLRDPFCKVSKVWNKGNFSSKSQALRVSPLRGSIDLALRLPQGTLALILSWNHSFHQGTFGSVHKSVVWSFDGCWLVLSRCRGLTGNVRARGRRSCGTEGMIDTWQIK